MKAALNLQIYCEIDILLFYIYGSYCNITLPALSPNSHPAITVFLTTPKQDSSYKIFDNKNNTVMLILYLNTAYKKCNTDPKLRAMSD